MIDALEICRLSRGAIAELLISRATASENSCRRQMARWPFPGTVELWVPDADQGQRYLLASCTDLGPGGVGVRCDESLEKGTTLPIAIHQPEVSFHGHATVRHCTRTRDGEYALGLQFHFEDDGHSADPSGADPNAQEVQARTGRADHLKHAKNSGAKLSKPTRRASGHGLRGAEPQA